MIIKRILTNNAVIVEVDNIEKIYCGKGIGFSKTKGDLIDESIIDKVFVLENNVNSNYESLLKDIPYEYFDLAQELVNKAKSELQIEFNNTLILTLADHIYGSVLRLKNHTIRKLDNPLLNDLIVFYSREFNIAKYTNQLIKKFENIEFSENEIGFIALHLVNCQKSLLDNQDNVNRIVDSALKIVEFSHHLKWNKESFDYNRFVTHLKYFALRATKKEQLKEKNKDDLVVLFDFVKTQYEKSFNTALKIKQFLLNEYKYEIDNNEVTYLTIHIHRLLNSN